MCGWNDYSNKVDIWSLGCILVEAITKQHFIHAKDVDKALFRDLMRKHPDPLEPETRAKLDRENRYQSMKQAPKRKEWDQLLSPIKTTYPDFIDLIKQMLCWDPDKRISASEALEHPLFQNYRETIKQIREQYPPKNEVPLIRVEPDMRRKHIMEKACFIFKNRKIYDWYNHRIMFQSLDLFDRYLYQTKENPCKDEFQLNLIFSLCIYIAIKYFVPLERIPSFTSLIPEELRKEEYIKQAQDLEKYLIEEIFKYDIYHDTVLEMADLYGDILNEEETEKLFNIYSSLTSYDGMKADRIYLVVRNALGK
jgi:serine/threonine protein kinase